MVCACPRSVYVNQSSLITYLVVTYFVSSLQRVVLKADATEHVQERGFVDWASLACHATYHNHILAHAQWPYTQNNSNKKSVWCMYVYLL